MDEPITPIERRESELCGYLRSLLYDRQKYENYLDFVDEQPTPEGFSWDKFEELIVDFEAQNGGSLKGAILDLDDQLDYISYVEIINQFKDYYTTTAQSTFKSNALFVIAIVSFGKIYLNFYFKHADKSAVADHNSQLILAFTRRHVMDVLKTMDDWAMFDKFLQTYVPTISSSYFERICLVIDRIALPLIGLALGYVVYRLRIA